MRENAPAFLPGSTGNARGRFAAGLAVGPLAQECRIRSFVHSWPAWARFQVLLFRTYVKAIQARMYFLTIGKFLPLAAVSRKMGRVSVCKYRLKGEEGGLFERKKRERDPLDFDFDSCQEGQKAKFHPGRGKMAA